MQGLRCRQAIQRHPASLVDSWGRALRFIDGPDQVHLQTVVRDEIKKSKKSGRSVFAKQGLVRPWGKGVGVRTALYDEGEGQPRQ